MMPVEHTNSSSHGEQGEVRLYKACAWCNALNEVSRHSCMRCGHDAHVATLACRCDGCTATQGVTEGSHA